jgi:hypothetical protein
MPATQRAMYEVMVFAPLAQLNAVASLQKRSPAKINLNGGNKT